MKIKRFNLFSLAIISISLIFLSCGKGGPSDEVALKDAKAYVATQGIWESAKITEYEAKIVGREVENERPTVQITGTVAFAGNNFGKPFAFKFKFQISVKYKKFGDEWQLDGKEFKIVEWIQKP